MPWQTTTYRRAQLYDEVWAEPVQTVAKRYGVSSVALAKMCRKLGVPVPARGYWARKAAGQKLKRPALPKALPGIGEAHTVTRTVPAEHEKAADATDTDPRVVIERAPEAAIVVLGTLDAPHPLVAAARRILSRAKPDENGMVASPAKRCLCVRVSPSSLDRSLRIMQALLSALPTRGIALEVTQVVPFDDSPYHQRRDVGPPSNLTRVRVDGEWISVSLVERWSIDRPPMPKQPRGLTGSELWAWTFQHKQRARHVPNGRLELALACEHAKAAWCDGKSRRLESLLNEVVARFYLLAAQTKKWRADIELNRQRADEADRRRLEEQRWAAREAQRGKGSSIVSLAGGSRVTSASTSPPCARPRRRTAFPRARTSTTRSRGRPSTRSASIP